LSYYYTSYDIDRAFKYIFRSKWHKSWLSVEVYFDELFIMIEPNTLEKQKEEFTNLLKDFFGGRFKEKEQIIKLDYGERKLSVIYEENVEQKEKRALPLFKAYNRVPEDDIFYELKGVPVIAFHSYKGGVGRTLSLLSAIQAVSKIKDENKSFKVLIVDSDIEAPGLTWLTSKINFNMSLLDAFSILHEEDNWRNALPFISQKIKTTTLELPVDKQLVEHFFMPVYRQEDNMPYQLIDLPVMTSTIIKMIDREWMIGDFFSELGKELGVNAVFVDLRAGISEFSAPLLFDSRIRKVYVTTTSLQSRKGLNALLKEIYLNKAKNNQELFDLFITMVPSEWNTAQKIKIEDEILENVNILGKDEMGEDNIPISYLEFAQELIHLDGLDTIDEKLKGTQMAKEIYSVILSWFSENITKTETISDVTSFLNRLIDRASEMEYAEYVDMKKIMITASLRNIVRRFKYEIPIAVILGAKGSGKTLIYRQLLFNYTWEQFASLVEKEVNYNDQVTFIVPFLIAKNIDAKKLKKNIHSINNNIGFKMSVKDFESRNYRIQEFQRSDNTEAGWHSFWKKELLKSTGLKIESFEELQNYLEERKKKIVFIVDGLEDIFQNIPTRQEQKIAVRMLIQDIINELSTYSDGRIGLLIFTRLDIAKNSIEQNWGQFNSRYSQFELKWNRVEALRLVLWLVKDAGFVSTVPNLEKATEEALIEALTPLWGVKLGADKSREAQSANWIIAALSDLRGRIQARDMVRFLKEAAIRSLKNPYYDRYLTPLAIKNSIKPCAEKKIMEIIEEMKYLDNTFNKLTNADKDKKQIPFEIEDFNLDSEEVLLLREQGFLIFFDDGYYMPEIIRNGLGFIYKKRARTKVISLLKEANF